MTGCDETPACPPFCPPPCPPPCPPQCSPCSPSYGMNPCAPCAPQCTPVDPLCPPIAEFVVDPDTARMKVNTIEEKLSNLGCQMNASVINKCLYQEQIARLEEEIVNTKRAYFSVLMSELNNLQSDLDAHECLLKDKDVGPTPAPEGPIIKSESKPQTPKKKKGKKKPGSAKGKGGNRSASSKRPASARSRRPPSAKSLNKKPT